MAGFGCPPRVRTSSEPLYRNALTGGTVALLHSLNATVHCRPPTSLENGRLRDRHLPSMPNVVLARGMVSYSPSRNQQSCVVVVVEFPDGRLVSANVDVARTGVPHAEATDCPRRTAFNPSECWRGARLAPSVQWTRTEIYLPESWNRARTSNGRALLRTLGCRSGQHVLCA